MTGLFKNGYFRSLIIFAACLFSYSNALNSEFAMDDHTILLGENSLKSFNSVFSLFSRCIYGFYRPFTSSILRFFNIIFGEHAFYYHLANLLLFYIVCLLFFKLVKLLTNDDKLAFLVSLIYCVHPINNLIVNFKTASMLAVFVIYQQLCVICFLKSFDARGRPNYFASLFFYLAACLSHEMGCLSLIYLFLIVYFLKKSSLRKSLSLCLPYLVILIAYYFVRSTVSVPQDNTRGAGAIFHLGLSMGAYIGIIVRLISWYLSKLLFPVKLLINWDVPLCLNYSLLLNTVFVISILVLVVIVSLKKNLICFSLALFMSGFIVLPVVPFVYSYFTKTAMIESHWFYFSSIGFFILAAEFIIYLSARIRTVVRPFLFILLILVILAGLTRQSNIVWAKEEDYCRYWISINEFSRAPKQYLNAVYGNRGTTYLKKGDLDQAISDFNQAIKIYSYDSEAYNNRGIAYANKGDLDQAISDFNKAIRINPYYAAAYNNRGIAYVNKGNFDQAILDCNQAIKITPDYVEAYNNRGIAYAEKGNPDQAILDYNKAIEIDPDYAGLYANRAVAYFLKHDYEKAWEDVHKAESLGAMVNPNFLEDLKKASGRER